MKLKYFLFFLLSFYILNSTFIIGTVRYVSKTGTSQQPYTSWQTAADSIQKCINICVDGDTIYVANGVYNENLVINTQIFLSGLSMDSTVIDGLGMGNVTISVFSDFILQNFKIYGKGNGIGDAVIRNPQTIGQLMIKNCIISEASIGISCVNGSLIVEDLLITDINLGISMLSTNIVHHNISDCTILENNENSLGISIGFASESTVYINNNIILFSGSNNPEYGISIGAPKKVYINNNLISGFRNNIFVDVIYDSLIINNNLLINQYFGGATASIYSINSPSIVNNVVLTNNKTGIRGTPVRANFNLFWKNETDLNGLTYGDSDIVADPMFVNDTIPSENNGYDFHLQKYSPAIDKGNPNFPDVDGSRNDIGLFGGPYGQIYTYQDLAPKPPANLTASMDSGLVHLKWNKNTEADFYRYRVYRDTVPDFIYDTTKIIAVISDTSFYDDPPQKYLSGNYYYKITALDNSLHQSAASEEVHINITGIPEAPPIVIENYNLLQNYPNPFNPSTAIPYRLKAPGYVKVMVYNILGELVRVLVNKYQDAGYYEVMFSPDELEKKRGEEGFPGTETWYHSNYVSGVYLFRIEVIGEGNIPVFTDMKKMMLVK